MVQPKNRIIWLTGQPGSGKTELSKILYKHYKRRGPTIIIDGDDLREKTGNFDYSKEGRNQNIANAQMLARFLYKSGFIVIVALVAPYRDLRENFKTEMGMHIFEAYLHYSNKIRGREDYFVLDYEAPLKRFVDVDTTWDTPKQSANKIIRYVQSEEESLWTL
jgi:adenylylsulfate kinase-like enzyme